MSPFDRSLDGSLNEYQRNRLRVTCEHIDKLLSDIEAVLNQSVSKSVFPKYAFEIPTSQRKTIEGFIARIRAQLLRILDGQEISKGKPHISPVHSIHVALTFINVAAEELHPKYMRGYGAVPEQAAADLNGIAGELLGLTAQLGRYVSRGVGYDLKERIEKLDKTQSELLLLRNIERVVTQRGLVEYRSAITNILDRAEDESFEIAVFGRVSSGKSSLLNAILRTDVLPVGVTPITAVLTRITHGRVPSMTVSFADAPSRTLAPDQLSEFATEQRNPANEKRVSRIVVQLPAARLKEGVTFVDTPGLGSLAVSGAAETLGYLPKCDLGVVLIEAASSLAPEDLQTIRTLTEATIPVTLLLSKSDLLNDSDRERVIEYVKQSVSTECSLNLPVRAVSALAEQRAALDEWFEKEIFPHYARCRELHAASLRRKIGSVRDTVASFLQAQLSRNQEGAAPSAERVRQIESRLRVATGQFESIFSALEEQAARLVSDLEVPLRAASVALLELWSGDDSSAASPESVVRDAISKFVQLQATGWQEKLLSLARELRQELISSAEDLKVEDRPGEDEFTSLVRELPIYDSSSLNFVVAKPSGLSFSGKRLGQRRLNRQLDRKLGAQLTAALDIYAALLSKWARSALVSLKNRFDSFADGYRARADGLQGAERLTEEQVREVRSDLELLEATEVASSGA